MARQVPRQVVQDFSEMTPEDEASLAEIQARDAADPQGLGGDPDDGEPAPAPVVEPGDEPLPPAEPEGEPEPIAEPTPAGEPEPEDPRARVPTAALVQERRRRQQAEEQARSLAQENEQYKLWRARLESRLQTLNEIEAQKQRAQAPALPDPNEDPLGHERAQRQLLEERIARQDQEIAQARQAGQSTNVMAAVQAMTQQFASRQTDYYDAIAFLQETRDRELELIGYEPQERMNIIANEAEMIVRGSLRRNLNPASAAYELAKLRGYAAAPTTPGGALTTPQLTRGNPADKIRALNRGRAATRSLSGVGGVAPREGMTVEKLLNMPEDELYEWNRKHPGAYDRLLKGA